MWREPGRGMTKGDCEGAHGGQWFDYALTKADCNAAETRRCCMRKRGHGDWVWCEQWNVGATTKEECEACFGEWISMFQSPKHQRIRWCWKFFETLKR